MHKFFHPKKKEQHQSGNKEFEVGSVDALSEKCKEQPPSEDDMKAYNTEVLPEQNKSIIWSIIKQLKIGESVKHLQLPIFVLQPRSLLEKLTDSFVHPELIHK
jgi:hypothetical protein